MLRGGGIDLILTDYRMPEMNGLEFLIAAERVAPGVPRVMLTAYPDQELATRASREAHVVLIISKPFDPLYFAEVVRGVIEVHARAEDAKVAAQH